jgi:hypothetical protein
MQKDVILIYLRAILETLRKGVYEMYGFLNKLFVVLCVPCIFLITSCAPTLVERVHAMKEAHNSGDVKKELSFFADDVRCEFGESFVINGKGELRKAVEQNALLRSRMAFADCKEIGNTVTCKVTEQNDMLQAAGIGPVYYEFSEKTYENGLIKRLRARPTQESIRMMGDFREAFGQWASDTYPQEWARLRAERVTKENVSKWLALVRAWRKEKEREK